MQPNNDPVNPSNPRPTPQPGGMQRQDFSQPVGSFARRPMAPQLSRNMDGFRPATPQQPAPQPVQQPAAPTPKFKPPQPSPGFKPPEPSPRPAPAPQPQPFTPPAPGPSPVATPPTQPQITPRPATPMTPTVPAQPRSPRPVSSREIDMDRDMESMRQDDLLGMTGSQIVPKKQKIPKGVFAIAALSVIGFVSSFFETSDTSLFYTVVLLASLLFTVGLFLRLEIARKLVFWSSAVVITVSIITAGALFMLMQRAEKHEQAFVAEAKRLNAINPQKSKEDQEMLDNMQKQVEAYREAVGDTVNFAYIRAAATVVAYAGVMVYISRPKVKEAFRKEIK